MRINPTMKARVTADRWNCKQLVDFYRGNGSSSRGAGKSRCGRRFFKIT
jgi:hypothetical protein